MPLETLFFKTSNQRGSLHLQTLYGSTETLLGGQDLPSGFCYCVSRDKYPEDGVAQSPHRGGGAKSGNADTLLTIHTRAEDEITLLESS
jgi:hypothetical protein